MCYARFGNGKLPEDFFSQNKQQLHLWQGPNKFLLPHCKQCSVLPVRRHLPATLPSCWFARLRQLWGVTGCVACFSSVSARSTMVVNAGKLHTLVKRRCESSLTFVLVRCLVELINAVNS